MVNVSSPRNAESYDNKNSKALERGQAIQPPNAVFRTVLNCNTYHIKANTKWFQMLTLEALGPGEKKKLGTESMPGTTLIRTLCMLPHQILIIHEVGMATIPILKISKLRHSHT